MVYRFINSLPKRWRYRAQHLWMHIRDTRDLVWSQSPGSLLQGALIVPFTGFLLLGFINLLHTISNVMWAAFLAYAMFLLILAVCKAIALFIAH
ncbi:hypothetical protein [Phormidium tenue]|uniref:Uncharacterized protein n=1 Tax=Phormidium tenue NIES-30 TaxID=549789 RepID=A0A1U7IY94_9CYAN|nr:hypothetical protein [Phormidium tenue]MBD2234883.1 hypothetical protein [Phormidium tenue FACHB-1052]OKH43623.1 hypothetical protein NIES30_24595 [Phormidium tenue NIES-30]